MRPRPALRLRAECYPQHGMLELMFFRAVMVAFFILANSFFVAAEFALISVRETRMEQLVALIYLHMRRFRPGGHLDAAIITAACIGIMSFSRGASTDMQMAAPLAIGLLGWYAWYETGSKFWLYDIYFFTGLATLAKGPVAPFLAALIIAAFAFLRREWTIIRRSFWWPGMVLYFAMVLPWFIAVQLQNPTFFRDF